MTNKETINKIITCLKGNLKSIQAIPYHSETIKDLENDIDNLENTLKDLEILEILRKGFVREGKIITYKGYNNENWDKVEEWLNDK